jgi:hypothetical protein
MAIIFSKVRCAKPRTEKQLLNDQRLKEKFIEYHHERKQLIKNEKIMDLLEESKITDAELTSLLFTTDEQNKSHPKTQSTGKAQQNSSLVISNSVHDRRSSTFVTGTREKRHANKPTSNKKQTKN